MFYYFFSIIGFIVTAKYFWKIIGEREDNYYRNFFYDEYKKGSDYDYDRELKVLYWRKYYYLTIKIVLGLIILIFIYLMFEYQNYFSKYYKNHIE